MTAPNPPSPNDLSHHEIQFPQPQPPHHEAQPPKQQHAPNLPSTRTLLTTLLNTLSSTPLGSPPPPPPAATKRDKTAPVPQPNPLSLVPATHRPLLVTLHVLFPSAVLPALELLEAGLVARAVLAAGDAPNPNPNPNQFHQGQDQDRVGQARRRWGVYLVTSTAAAGSEKRRRQKGSRDTDAEAGRKGYVVWIDAWQCSCAGFAFASVQGGTTTTRGYQIMSGSQEGMGFTGKGTEEGRHDSMVSQGTGAEEENDTSRREWSFGGLSLDGLAEPGAGETVPVCKHLLACVLAERWGDALGRYVVERRVGREEMAGILAEV